MRTTGGGYLSLATHLEEQLELVQGCISDNYDMGHKDQLAVADVLLKSDFNIMYEEIVGPIFQMMAEFKNHKTI